MFDLLSTQEDPAGGAQLGSDAERERGGVGKGGILSLPQILLLLPKFGFGFSKGFLREEFEMGDILWGRF